MLSKASSNQFDSQPWSIGNALTAVFAAVALVGVVLATDAQARSASKSLTTKTGKPDLIATNIGVSVAGGVHKWGSSVKITNAAYAVQKGLGPKKNLCLIKDVRFRPFNKGNADAGPFGINLSVKHNGQQIYSFANGMAGLKTNAGLPFNGGWLTNNILVAQGTNKFTVIMDGDKMVDESDEGNNKYGVTLKVSFPCTLKPGEPKSFGIKKN